jgi:tRNA threonylcarbamoyladenosine biosynthesis protein TsaB
MIVLALDTTTSRESVAVVSAGVVRGEVRLLSDEGHSRRLVGAIEFLLQGLELAPAAVEGFAVTTGPGSFTGLRVGLSTVQGLALAAERPCLGISALDVLAARIAGEAPHLVALMEAHRGELFAARYDQEARLVEGPVVTVPEPWLLALPSGCAFIGDAVERLHASVVSACAAPRFPERGLFLAGTLGRLAEPRLLGGEGVGAGELRPLYLREPAIRRAAP